MTVLANATLLQFGPPKVEPGMDIVIDSGIIQAAGKGIAADYPPDSRRDLYGKIVMPGLVCSHNHFYSGLARGIMANIKPSTDFVSQLRNLWWKLDRALDEESLYYSSIICALESIKAGTTAVIDHHSSQNYIGGSLCTLRRGFEEAGLRGVLCFEVTDRNGAAKMEEGIEENISFVRMMEEAVAEEAASGPLTSPSDAGDVPGAQGRTIVPGERPLVRGMFGGHAPFTVPDGALKQIADAAEKAGKGFHIHTAEDAYDQSHSHGVYGKDLLERLDEFGLVNDKSIFAHGLFFTGRDREILNSRDAYLVHNCRSNMNNTVGYNHHLQDINNNALGTDGIGSNMFEEFTTAFFKHRDAGGPLWPDSFLAYLQNGNILMERHFGGRFGRIKAGYAADLVVLDYQSPTPLEPENIGGHIAFAMASRDVHTVIIDGVVVYENRTFPGRVDEIYCEAQQAASKLWKRMDELS